METPACWGRGSRAVDLWVAGGSRPTGGGWRSGRWRALEASCSPVALSMADEQVRFSSDAGQSRRGRCSAGAGGTGVQPVALRDHAGQASAAVRRSGSALTIVNGREHVF